MRNRCIRIAFSLMMVLLILQGVAMAHGKEKHDKTAPANAQTKKLHAMMQMFSVASAKLQAALEKGEVAAVETEAGKIMAALPDLKKSKPQKSIKQLKKYGELTTNFEETVSSTVELAKKGDLPGAKAAFKKAEEICAACHAKFGALTTLP